jgi:hypothetical protein
MENELRFWEEAFLIAWREAHSKAQGAMLLQSPVLAARAAVHADYAEAHRRERAKDTYRWPTVDMGETPTAISAEVSSTPIVTGERGDFPIGSGG